MRQLIKKNGFTDYTSLFFVIAVLFGVAIFFIILSYTYGEIQPKISDSLSKAATPETGKNVTEILEQIDTSIIRMNVLFPLLLIGLFGFVMVSALMARSHPAFFFIGLIVLGVTLILAAVYSNVYQEIADDDKFASTTSDFSIMGLFLENLPTVIVIFFIAIAIILYTRVGGSVGM